MSELPPELQVFLDSHPDWEHVVFMRRHVLLQLVKPLVRVKNVPEGMHGEDTVQPETGLGPGQTPAPDAA